MMPRMEGGVSSRRDERRAGERRSDEAKTRGAFESATELFGDVFMDGTQLRSREVGGAPGGESHEPVTFWTADGTRHEGMTPCVKGEMLFVESKRMVPVGGKLTVSLAPREGQSTGQELSEGIVVWHCPFGDEFENLGGFGVRLQGRWPKGPALVAGAKEPA